MFLLLALASTGGAQVPITSWQPTLSLPTPDSVSAAVAYGNHIFALAGSQNVLVGEVDLETGDVVSWASTPLPAFVHQVGPVAALIDRFLVVPGYPLSAVATLMADGSISGWQQAPGTNTAATGGRAVAVEGRRVFVVGAGAPFVAFDSVETATLAADGTLSPWQSLNPLPFGMISGLATTHGGYLYALGGHSSTPGGDLSHAREVYRAETRADGTLGPWSFVGQLLQARTNTALIRFEDTVHILGGGLHSYITATVESALAAELGLTTRHIQSAPLPTPLAAHGAVAVDRYGYVLGGTDTAFGTHLTATVYVTELAPANEPPVADAGDDLVVAAGAGCLGAVVLDGTGSYDPDGDALEHTWSGLGGPYDSDTLSLDLPLGRHTFELTVTDSDGATGTDSVEVDVVDETPPVVAVAASPSSLWPPNHRMVDVLAIGSAFDACDPPPLCEVVGVASSEPVLGIGDGDTSPDWEVVSIDLVRLRAERSGGDGRVYTISVRCTDGSGNAAEATTTVTVAKSQRN